MTKARAMEGEVLKSRRRLTPKQERFCQLYASDVEFFGNGTASYIEAYSPSRLNPGWYNTARARASQLLTNVNILSRINELLETDRLNDAHVDKQLAFLVTQNADFSTKMRAITEYNKLKGRIEDKVKHSGELTLKPASVMPVGELPSAENKPETT